MMLTSLYSTKNCETTAAKSKIYFKNIVDIEWQLCELKTNYVWWWVNCQRMFQMHKWIKVLFTVESWWGQVGPSLQDLQSWENGSCDRYFHQNEPYMTNWKTFSSRHVWPSKPPYFPRFNHRHRCPERSCARSNAPHKTEERNYLACWSIILMLIVSPWWQSEECECWPPWLAQGLLHHFPSTWSRTSTLQMSLLLQ